MMTSSARFTPSLELYLVTMVKFLFSIIIGLQLVLLKIHAVQLKLLNPIVDKTEYLGYQEDHTSQVQNGVCLSIRYGGKVCFSLQKAVHLLNQKLLKLF